MNNVEGTVKELREVEFKPGHVLHSLQIEGSNDWFSLGKVDPVSKGAVVGRTIAFAERNRRVNPESLQVIAGETARTNKPVVKDVGAVSKYEGYDKPVLSSNVASRIQWQAARKDATAGVVAALHTDSLPWASNVAKSKKLDLLQGYITELTNQLLEEESKHG